MSAKSVRARVEDEYVRFESRPVEVLHQKPELPLASSVAELAHEIEHAAAPSYSIAAPAFPPCRRGHAGSILPRNGRS